VFPDEGAPESRLKSAVSPLDREISLNAENDPSSQFQEQLLSSIKAQQEGYLNALKAWNRAVNTPQAAPPSAPAFPPPPAAPSFDQIPGSTKMIEANKAFMQKVIAQQQEFLRQVGSVIGGTDQHPVT